MAGYHLFSVGEVLTAANVNDYVMKQTVMVFASAAARTTALSGVLREGMISYRTDSHITEYYNGSAWATLGSVLTTKGDLATYDTAAARLAVGADGTTLVANSSAATGLSYQPLNSAGKNAIINGGMDIWQRGTSVAYTASTTNTYNADRWTTTTGANQASVVSRQATGDTTNLPNIQYALRYQRNSGQTGTTATYLIQSIESANSIPFAGKQVTASFYARAGANYSAASSILAPALLSGTGTDQSPFSGGGFTGVATVASTNATLTTTWQRFSITGTVGATATELAIQFAFTPVGTAGVNDYYEVTGVQLEIGSVATNFSRAGGTLPLELVACQRYYAKSYPQGTTVPTNSSDGLQRIIAGSYSPAAGDIYGTINFPVVMRSAPTVTVYSYSSSTANMMSNNQGISLAAASAVVLNITDRQGGIYNNSGGSLTPANGGFGYHYAASAEL